MQSSFYHHLLVIDEKTWQCMSSILSASFNSLFISFTWFISVVSFWIIDILKSLCLKWKPADQSLTIFWQSSLQIKYNNRSSLLTIPQPHINFSNCSVIREKFMSWHLDPLSINIHSEIKAHFIKPSIYPCWDVFCLKRGRYDDLFPPSDDRTWGSLLSSSPATSQVNHPQPQLPYCLLWPAPLTALLVCWIFM